MKLDSAYKIIWSIERILRAHEGKYFFPVQIARELKITWIEAELGLRLCVQHGTAFRRSDGRYLLKQPARPSDAWETWIKSEEGQICSNPGPAFLQREFLENRLWRAFAAGRAAGAQR